MFKRGVYYGRYWVFIRFGTDFTWDKSVRVIDKTFSNATGSGPACFGILSQTDFITECAKIGVIVLMFSAGLETDIVGLKKCGAAAFVIAMLGVLVPLGGGFLLSYIFNGKLIPSDATSSLFYQNIFIGVILTATSVSITVETLKELGKLNCAAGNAIMGAAIIDDILGIIALTIITSVGDPESDAAIGIVLFKIVAFFVLAGIAGYVFYRIFKVWTEHADKDRRRFVIVAFVFCLLMSYVAEVYFGVADITGAYFNRSPSPVPARYYRSLFSRTCYFANTEKRVYREAI